MSEKATLPVSEVAAHHSESDEDLVLDGVDPVYTAKARVLNKAIQDIGMGRYQWQLFGVIGFGWAQDNLWPIITSLILSPVTVEYARQVSKPPLLTLAQNIGLLAGAVFWGFGCDIFGRRIGFNATLGVTALFGMLAASSPNFAAVGVFAALWSFGVGGNLPVDSAIFLEFLPRTHQYLLTVLSVFWALAQLIITLIAWPLLGNLSCADNNCSRRDNMGWRYLVIVGGGIALIGFFLRFFVFTIYESPKYLMGKGRDEDAVKIVHEVARRNGKLSTLTIEDLKACDAYGTAPIQTDVRAAIKRKLAAFSSEHILSLFGSGRLAFSTGSIIGIWAFIGLAFPLYNAFIPYTIKNKHFNDTDTSTYRTYRDSLIIAVLGVPGAALGGWFVESKYGGRKITLSVSTVLTGVFILCTTASKSADQLLAWNCVYSFFSNVMFAVLYSYTPEVFPTKDRGTGNALAATANRIFGIMAPLIRMFGNTASSAPVYVSGALFVIAGLFTLTLPYESRGKAAL